MEERQAVVESLFIALLIKKFIVCSYQCSNGLSESLHFQVMAIAFESIWLLFFCIPEGIIRAFGTPEENSSYR